MKIVICITNNYKRKNFMSVSHSEFSKNSLLYEDLNPNPYLQFSEWQNDYIQLNISDSIAMSFSTINDIGFPTSRIVYLRDFDANGFVFFTNYNSNKGEEIKRNNKANMLFYWPELERQVRVWGKVNKVEEDMSDNYFKDRPKESQASAWISNQSKEIKDRVDLEKMHKKLLQNNLDKIIIRPKFWGGYRLTPVMFEFWQGRPNRLHDRFLYEQIGENWKIKRLAP